MRRRSRVVGRLIMVQESRFRLAAAGGQTLLLGLADDAGVDELGLLALYRRNIQVAVEFTGEPGLASGIAHSLVPVDASTG